jgi:hypothetical protein
VHHADRAGGEKFVSAQALGELQHTGEWPFCLLTFTRLNILRSVGRVDGGGDDIHAVVAIACEKELQEGMGGVFPKPGLGIINIRPHGPCTDTDVDLEEVEEAIKWFLRD